MGAIMKPARHKRKRYSGRKEVVSVAVQLVDMHIEIVIPMGLKSEERDKAIAEELIKHRNSCVAFGLDSSYIGEIDTWNEEDKYNG